MTDWKDLDREFDRWAAAGAPATLWWRDDDASKNLPQLARLVALADDTKTPLHLAVIPGLLENAAADVINASPFTRVLQHGYRHVDYAPKGQGSWELGDHRPIEVVLAELKQGSDLLREAFADKFLPVLVPPWTRISHKVAAHAQQAGFSILSLEGRRRECQYDSYVNVINPHCDPIKWKQNARFKGTSRVLNELLEHLSDRRADGGDRDEATGICTHHMDHSEELWEFLELYTRRTSAHKGARWITLDEYLS